MKNGKLATPDDILGAFAEYHEELCRLAWFLTGDEEQTETCIVNARSLAKTYDRFFLNCPQHWARRAVIVSAVKLQQFRITQLGVIYGRHRCSHRKHDPLVPEQVRLLKRHYRGLAAGLDVLCRFALVVYGIEKYSPLRSALMLGINRTALDGAYCAALEALEILRDANLPD